MLGEELSHLVQQYDRVYFSSEVITLADWLKKLDNGHGLTKWDFFSDGVHPSKLTYQTWARELAKFISALEVKNFPLLSNKS